MPTKYDILREDIKDVKSDVKDLREKDIKSLRERIHKTENNSASSAALLAETTSNLAWALDMIENIREKIDKSNLDTEKRFTENEKITKKIEIVTSHWKIILTIIIGSIILGFCIDNGLKDAVKITAKLFVPDKIVKVAESFNG